MLFYYLKFVSVLEQIDCERLAKTVNKRAVILTNFMLTNLMEAISQLLTNTTLLTTLLLEGLPLKIPYLNPLNEVSVKIATAYYYIVRCWRLESKITCCSVTSFYRNGALAF